MTLDPWEKNSVLAFYDWFTRLLYHVIVDFVWVCDFEATWNFSGSLVSPCYISLCDSYVCPKTRSEIIIWNHYLKKARGGKVISYSCGCAFFPNFFFFFWKTQPIFLWLSSSIPQAEEFLHVTCGEGVYWIWLFFPPFLYFLSSAFFLRWETRTTCIQDHTSVNLCGDKPGNNAKDLLLRSQSILISSAIPSDWLGYIRK